ncbi:MULTISPECIES: hypothetical protein [unclassified Psychrobacter]|uniref:hypothetical protein n=1 Tax=unclassified Psychrobacter TaxID=196806 RepID=UPI0025B5D3FF|nr:MULTISPECIES: hypothetical protein [unclassified Psychrobacter]MDN3452433.1 hypothetical protein [Psychrobacter sp. APC 3350]MDN3502440.1 hypothetical protein [Psychrobacter sp. 5A.1]
MEPISFASLTLTSILASLPANGEAITKPTITTHISPAIAGQWEIDLDSSAHSSHATSTKEAEAKQAALNRMQQSSSVEPKVMAGMEGGVLTQSEARVLSIQPITNKNITASVKKSNQCRELYNFGADNEMWAVSGKEWTYGRYLVTHREEGLPVIAIKTVYDNNEVDCSGNQVDQTDEALIAFINHDGNQMQWCADPDGNECFMNFNRVLP